MALPKNYKDLVFAMKDGKSRWFTRRVWDNMPEATSPKQPAKYGWVQTQPPTEAVTLNDKLKAKQEAESKAEAVSAKAEIAKDVVQSKSMQFTAAKKSELTAATNKLKTIAEVEAFYGADERAFAIALRDARIKALELELNSGE